MAITSILRLSEIQQPVAENLGGGLLDHVSIQRNQEHLLARDDNALWRSYREIMPLPRAFDPCDDDQGVTYDPFEWAQGTTFAVEIGTECSILGLDEAEQKRKMKAQFDAAENHSVEYALEAVLGVEATDLTPTGTGAPELTPVQALAALEDRAARLYPYKPIIHMPRYVLALLGDRIVWKGDKAFTRSGIPVAAGGGYGGADIATWTAPTMYVTGQIFIESTPEYGVDNLVAPNLGTDGTAASLITTYRRAYRVGFEGPVLSITAKKGI